MSFNAVVQDTAAYTAIPLALAGFGITFWQIARTRRVAEAARDAARSTQSDIIRSSLLILIPQLQRVEEELDRAIQIGSDDLAMTCLANWRWQAGQVRGYLSRTSKGNRQIISSLQSSIAMAAQVKSAIIDSSAADLADITKSARDAIADVTNELGMLAAVQGTSIGDEK
jgi:hypothetical protein